MDWFKLLSLRLNDRKWLLVMAAINMMVFYCPPVDLIKHMREYYDKCMYALLLIPLFISIQLLLIYFSKSWGKWNKIIFVYVSPALVILFLLTDTIRCTANGIVLKPQSDKTKENAKLDTSIVENGEKNYIATRDGKEKVIIKYIPKIIQKNGAQVVLNLYLFENSEKKNDTLKYKVLIYDVPQEFDGLLFPNYYYSIENLTASLPITLTEIFVNGLSYRLGILIYTLKKVFLRYESEPGKQINTGVNLSYIHNDLIESIEGYILLKSLQSKLSPTDGAKLNQSLSKLSYVHDLADFRNDVFELVSRNNQSLNLDNEEADFFQSSKKYKEFKDSINLLKRINADLSDKFKKIINQKTSEQEKKILSDYYDATSRLSKVEFKYDERLKENEMLARKVFLLENTLYNVQRENAEIKESVQVYVEKAKKCEEFVVKYTYKKKAIFIENNSVHKMNRLDGIVVILRNYNLKSDSHLLFFLGENQIHKQKITCGIDDYCEIIIPRDIFQNYKSYKGNAEIIIKEDKEPTKWSLTFNINGNNAN